MILTQHKFTVDIDDELINNGKITPDGYLNPEKYFRTSYGVSPIKTLKIGGRTALVGDIKRISPYGIPTGNAKYHIYDPCETIIESILPYFTSIPKTPIRIEEGDPIDCFVCSYPEFAMVTGADTSSNALIYATDCCLTISDTTMLNMMSDFNTITYNRHDIITELKKRYGKLPSKDLVMQIAYEYTALRNEVNGEADDYHTWRDCLNETITKNAVEIEADLAKGE